MHLPKLNSLQDFEPSIMEMASHIMKLKVLGSAILKKKLFIMQEDMSFSKK